MTSATLASEAKSSTLVDVKIAVGGITATCSLDWSLWFGDLDANQHPSKKDCDKWLVFCGAGSAQVTAKNVGLQTKFGIESADFASRPPRKATVEDLDLQIAFSIDKLEGTLSTFWGMIKGAFGDEITKLVAREVTAAVDGDVQVLIGDLLTELLANATALVDPYLAPPPPARYLTDEAAVALSLPPGKAASLYSWDEHRAILDAILFVLEDQLGAASTCSGGAANPRLGVNELVDSMLNNTNGEIDMTGGRMGFKDVELVQMSDAITRTNMTLAGVRLTGLNTFTKLKILNTKGRWTSTHDVALADVGVTVHLNLSMLEGELVTRGVGEKIEQSLALHTGVKGIAGTIGALVAIDTGVLADLQLGSLMETPVPCLLSVLAAANLTRLVAGIQGFSPAPSVDGFISKGTDKLLNDAVDAAMLLFKGSLVNGMPTAMETLVRPMVNGFIGTFMADPNYTSCSSSSSPTGTTGNINFQVNEGLQMVAHVINDRVGVQGCRNVNTFIGAAAKYQSGEAGAILIPSDMVKLNIDEPSIGKISLTVSNLTVRGLDTLYELNVLNATGPHTLHHVVALAKSAPLMASIRVAADVQAFGMDMVNHFTIGLALSDMRAVLGTTLKIDPTRGVGLQLKDLQRPACLLRLLETEGGLRIPEMTLTAQQLRVFLDCETCTTVGLVQLGTDYLRRPEAIAQTTAVLNQALAAMRVRLNDPRTLKAADRLVRDISDACRESNATNATVIIDGGRDRSSGIVTYLIVIASAFFVVIVILVIYARHMRNKFLDAKGRGTFSSLGPPSYDPPRSKTAEGAAAAGAVEVDVSKLNVVGSSSAASAASAAVDELEGIALISHPEIPKYIRWGIPVWIVASIALFVSANTNVGAQVELTVTLGGDIIKVPNLFAFTLEGSIQDMWTAKVYTLSIIVAVFSGAWPYLKLLVLTFCWCTRPSHLSLKKRGQLLSGLDILGKWSVLDQYVMVIMMVAFRLEIDLPGTTGMLSLPPKFLNVDVQIIPLWGFYGFFIATMTSLVINHVIIVYHRNVVSHGWLAGEIMPSSDLSFPTRMREPSLAGGPAPGLRNQHGEHVSRHSSDDERKGSGGDGGVGGDGGGKPCDFIKIVGETPMAEREALRRDFEKVRGTYI